MSFDGMEHYYHTQAREWERYAMIKARQVAGDAHTGQQLASMIKPFVYRRYLDYGAFEELRNLKFQIMQELKRKDRLDNVKLGPGGIREVEFIGQAFQLIRGGQVPALQQREIQAVLATLADMQLMQREDANELIADYRFLRRVENHIQQFQDKQTHDLPMDALGQQILAYSLDFADWSSFKLQLDNVRTRVHTIFNDVFSLSKLDNRQQNLALLWAANAEDPQAQQILSELGYSCPAPILQAVAEFKTNPALKRLSRKGIAVVQRLIPLLLEQLPIVENEQQTLERILALIIAVTGRNVYLSLLTENPDALRQLIKLSAASPWISQFLARYPILFDELLDVRRLYEPLDKSALCLRLQLELDKIDAQDSEQLMIALRQFKHLHMLRVAAADIMGVIPVMIVSDYLTWIAEAILEQVWQRAWQLLADKHGFPPGSSLSAPDFAIIGFGKLGGVELGYASDLDLVFVYNCPDDNAMTNGTKPINCGQFYLRLGQKIRFILDTKMLSGILYEVDLRLRPNGDSGLLVSHINFYEDYLQHHAWTWEHQALVRARFITGDTQLQQIFDSIRQRILALPRDPTKLKTDVREMREKMRLALAKNGKVFDLKQGRGGLADIEFMVQFGILAMAAQHPELSHNTGSVRLLDALQQLGFMAEADAMILIQTYCNYRDYGHHRILQGYDATAAETEFEETRAAVVQIWHNLMEN
jgi:glutamate-ammonia-ligase adenylyltransferase